MAQTSSTIKLPSSCIGAAFIAAVSLNRCLLFAFVICSYWTGYFTSRPALKG
jgi:hypothetical protein